MQPDNTYSMHGSRISVSTLDLNRPFEEIQNRLNGIASEIERDRASLH